MQYIKAFSIQGDEGHVNQNERYSTSEDVE